jgi:amidase
MPDATATDLLFRPALELGGMVRAGEVTSRELVEAALARIDALNPSVNAFIHVDAEGALAAADAIEPGDQRPFAGVPIGVKTEFPVEGLPITMGSDLFGDFIAPHDAYLVRRLREAGCVIVGMTNMPEMGIMPVTEPRRHGATRNPWDLERTPGGSSGGAAAAVAAGMVPLAHGADGGGSIRIPAACCGLVGLKATRHRISRGPDVGEHWLSIGGVLTRTVADTAAALDAIEGYEVGDAAWLDSPAEPFARAAERDPGRMRIALTLDPPVDTEIHPECARATREAAKLLSSLGHQVEEVAPQVGKGDLAPLFLASFGASLALVVRTGGIITEREPTPELVEPLTWAIYEMAQGLNSVDYLGAVTQLQGFARGFIQWLSGYDALLTPSLATLPVPIGTYDTGSSDVGEWGRTGEFTPFTAVANLTGLPAISLPFSQSEEGLPLGVHLMGRPAREDQLLALGAQLEAERDWASRRPALANGA